MSPKMTPLGRPEKEPKMGRGRNMAHAPVRTQPYLHGDYHPAPASPWRHRDQSSYYILRMASRQLQLAAQAPYASFRKQMHYCVERSFLANAFSSAHGQL